MEKIVPKNVSFRQMAERLVRENGGDCYYLDIKSDGLAHLTIEYTSRLGDTIVLRKAKSSLH